MRFAASYLERLGREWQRAYQRANDGKPAPAITWERGWFIIEGHRYRRAAVERMRDTLQKVDYSSGQRT